jgi:hypothetical protein
MQGTYGEVGLERPLRCVSHRALAAITRATLENSPSKVRAPENIENNPMQSNRPPEKQLDPSGKSPA